MESTTAPLFTMILFFLTVGIIIALWGLADRRDTLALGGLILIASCINGIVNLAT